MKQNFSSRGYFFLPKNEKDRVSGEITFIADEGITLKILGDLDISRNLFNEKNHEILHGVLENGKEVTLMSNILINRNRPSPGINTLVYKCSKMLVGEKYNSTNDIIFDEINVQFNNLFDWLQESGISEERGNNFLSLKYNVPPDINFYIREDEATFEFLVGTSESNNGSFTINQGINLKLHYAQVQNIKQLLEDIYIFQGLLTFATFETSYPTSIKLNLSANGQKKQNVEMFSSTSLDVRISPNKFFNYLFSYQGVKDNWQEIVNNWWSQYGTLEPVIDLYLRDFYNHKSKFSENQFLEVIHALESINRRTSSSKLMPTVEFRIRKKEIISSAKEEYREWLKEKLNYANEINLSTRLTEIFNKISHEDYINQLIKDKDDFNSKVRNTRNYYTHYSKELEIKALSGRELYETTVKLRIILSLLLLDLIGVNHSQQKRSVDMLRNTFNYFTY